MNANKAKDAIELFAWSSGVAASALLVVGFFAAHRLTHAVASVVINLLILACIAETVLADRSGELERDAHEDLRSARELVARLGRKLVAGLGR